jgi:hypothetical protein
MDSHGDRFDIINGTLVEVDSGNRARIRLEAEQEGHLSDGSASGRVAFCLDWERPSTPEDDRQAQIGLEFLLRNVCGLHAVQTIGGDHGGGAVRRARHYVRTGSTADPILN